MSRSYGSPSSPRDALIDREEHLEGALARAIVTIEDRMTSALVERRKSRSFSVGHSLPPLGGGTAWIDQGVVPSVIEIYTDLGWRVRDDGTHLTFTLPEDA